MTDQARVIWVDNDKQYHVLIGNTVHVFNELGVEKGTASIREADPTWMDKYWKRVNEADVPKGLSYVLKTIYS